MMSGRQQVEHLLNSIALSTLANNAAIIANTKADATRDQGVRFKEFKAAYTITGLTAGEGPLIYGWATELTATEIAEAISADPQGVDDTDASDKANRKVFPVGVFGMANTSTNEQTFYRNVRYPFKELPEGSTLKFFVFNASGATLTTGAVASVTAVVVQEWMRD